MTSLDNALKEIRFFNAAWRAGEKTETDLMNLLRYLTKLPTSGRDVFEHLWIIAAELTESEMGTCEEINYYTQCYIDIGPLTIWRVTDQHSFGLAVERDDQVLFRYDVQDPYGPPTIQIGDFVFEYSTTVHANPRE